MGEVNDEKSAAVTEKLYENAEKSTNIFNAKCLLILAAICLLCELLNEIKAFSVVPQVMRIGTACGIIMYLVPALTLLFSHKKPGTFESDAAYRSWFKYYILIFAWLGTMATCIMLTHHTVLVMAIPILLMSQYKDTKKLVPLTVLLATICTILGVYGGYFLGCFDANLLHATADEYNTFDLAMRLDMATTKRMTELFTHYALGREMIVIALIILASGCSHRNSKMLKQQAELQLAVSREMQHTNEIQRQIIDGMANLIENRDSSTGEHVKRTSYYVSCIARELSKNPKYAVDLSDDSIGTIVKAASLHDIGKIVVTDRILQKPGKLTPEEYDEIKRHASEGAQVIKNVLGSVEDEEFLKVATEIAGSHHERWDGTGYPNGESGESIPLPARIMAVADVFDALVSERVYKKPIPPEEAYRIIENESGKEFDPQVVEAFCKIKPQITAYLSNESVNLERGSKQQTSENI